MLADLRVQSGAWLGDLGTLAGRRTTWGLWLRAMHGVMTPSVLVIRFCYLRPKGRQGLGAFSIKP